MKKPADEAAGYQIDRVLIRDQATKRMMTMPMQAMSTLLNMRSGQYFFGQFATPRRRPMYWICEAIRMKAGARIVTS